MATRVFICLSYFKKHASRSTVQRGSKPDCRPDFKFHKTIDFSLSGKKYNLLVLMRLQKLIFAVAGVRSQESGDRRQETGDRSQEAGVRSQETGDRRQETGVRRQ